jgi:hypothetical protein
LSVGTRIAPGEIFCKDLLGQEVATAFVGNSEAGKINTGRFDTTNPPAGQAGLPSGTYFYQLGSDYILVNPALIDVVIAIDSR